MKKVDKFAFVELNAITENRKTDPETFSKSTVYFYPNPKKRRLAGVIRIERQIGLSIARALNLPNDECGYAGCACYKTIITKEWIGIDRKTARWRYNQLATPPCDY